MALIGFVRRRPLACYFSLVYLLSGIVLAVIGVPKLDGAASRSMLPLVMLPVMAAGVGLTGIVLTAVTAGREGLRELRARFRRPVAPRWLAVLLIPRSQGELPCIPAAFPVTARLRPPGPGWPPPPSSAP